MKLTLVFTSMIISSVCFAGPTVGDQVTYSATGTQNGTASTVTLSEQITAIDSTSQMVSILESTVYNGAVVDSETDQLALSNMYYPTADDVANCSVQDVNGQTADLETITVTAGTFQTCHISTPADANGNSNDYFYANVPFGMVKVISASSIGVETTELVSFQSASALQ